MILSIGKHLLETGRRAQDRLDRSGRCRVISALRPSARREQRPPCCRRERAQASRADVHSERGGKDVFELMGLVDDKCVMLRQDLAPTSQISAEKMEIHDDDVRGGCLSYEPPPRSTRRPTDSDGLQDIRRR